MAGVLPQKTGSKAGNILVVDDMEVVLHMVVLLLSKFGYTVYSAGNVQDGLRILREQAIDLVVSDVMMPERDGIDFLKEVRRHTLHVPVVLMTGSAHLEMAMEAIKYDAFDLITKPLDGPYFRKIVEKALEYRRLMLVERNYQGELERTVAQQTMQLKEVLLELDKFHNHAKSIAEERSQFLTTLTHELRTPMNGIVCPLSMLKESPLAEDDRELVEIAASSADRMVRLVNQLLSFAESQNTRSASDKKPFDLGELSASLAKAYKPAFQAKGIALSFSVAENQACRVVGDRELTCKIVDVLLGNALEFTESGSTSLIFSATMDARLSPTLHIQVSDTGIGIPCAELETVFEPFFQVDGGLTRKHG